jgi:hypothetical protein
VCVLFDFVLAPTGYQIAQTIAGTTDFTQWAPLTLQGNAMFHISMLTIVGVTAYGRTQEKLKKVTTEVDSLKKTAGQEIGCVMNHIFVETKSETNILIGCFRRSK